MSRYQERDLNIMMVLKYSTAVELVEIILQRKVKAQGWWLCCCLRVSCLTWLVDSCSGVQSVGLLLELQGCMRCKGAHWTWNWPLHKLTKKVLWKGKGLREIKVIYLYFSLHPHPTIFLSHQQHIQLSHVNAYLTWISWSA